MTMDQSTLIRHGLALAWFIVAWDVIEGVVAVTAGLASGSIALVGFGIEVFAASVVIWQLRGGTQARHRPALKAISVTFYILAVYVAIETVRELLTADKAGESLVGIILNIVALAVMTPIAIAQAAPAGNCATRCWSPSRKRPGCPTICPSPCWPGSPSTPPSAGGGPTPSPPWSSPLSRNPRDGRPGTKPRRLRRPSLQSVPFLLDPERCPWPGLILEWRRTNSDDWQARVVYVPDPRRPRAVEDWFGQQLLRPMDPPAPSQAPQEAARYGNG
ncbi:hypothetical protein GCM10009789_77230 [Kribbella sancticallisti]|uniref:Cation efflux family protein n=1 Tax=Kribbella sancticallisti TaxID=460087 RepID=A0ABP4QIR5_9ACTN